MALNFGSRLCKLLSCKPPNRSLVSRRGIKRYVKPTLFELCRRDRIYRRETDPEKLLQRDRRSNFIEWNHNAEIYAFGKRLQEDFDLKLLNQAFIHRSYVTSGRKKMAEVKVELNEEDLPHNETLAEIGEKVISDHVRNYVSYFFPRFPSEGIESVHGHLLSESNLCHISKNIGTRDIILSGDYPVEDATFARTFKAIVGALRESSGPERANLFVRDLVVTRLAGSDINDFLPVDNYLEVVGDILQRDGRQPPEPRIICQSACNTILANYHVGIYSDQQLIGHCFGETVGTAVEMAALDVLKRFFHTTESSSWIRYDAVLPVEHKPANVPLCEWSLSRFQGKS